MWVKDSSDVPWNTHLLIQSEKATCSPCFTVCVVPSDDAYEVPPIVLTPCRVDTTFLKVVPMSRLVFSCMYNWVNSSMSSLPSFWFLSYFPMSSRISYPGSLMLTHRRAVSSSCKLMKPLLSSSICKTEKFQNLLRNLQQWVCCQLSSQTH